MPSKLCHADVSTAQGQRWTLSCFFIIINGIEDYLNTQVIRPRLCISILHFCRTISFLLYSYFFLHNTVQPIKKLYIYYNSVMSQFRVYNARKEDVKSIQSWCPQFSKVMIPESIFQALLFRQAYNSGKFIYNSVAYINWKKNSEYQDHICNVIYYMVTTVPIYMVMVLSLATTTQHTRAANGKITKYDHPNTNVVRRS